MNLMKDDVVYLENDSMYKVKEAFGIFWYFPTYLKMSRKINFAQKQFKKKMLDSIVKELFFSDQ